ncbi:MAG: S1 RNA-binding domain-containing protein, partial [Persicimonas sp.]
MTQTEEKTTDIGEAKYNTTCEGTFVEALDGEYVFELEDGTPAVIDGAEYGDEPHFEEGEEVELLVEHPLADGRWRASARKIEKLAFWDRLTELADSDETIEGEIVAPNKGGLSVDIGLRAFCPRSQVDIHRVDDVAPYVGRRERFHVIQFDGDRCNVVLSRRKVVEKEREAKREETIAKLEPGQVFEGVVRNLKKYGAFVDVGGIDGLLHVSNMSWGRVDHPSEVVQPGDRLEVVVLDFDEERDRLSL